ncbi:MAG: PQQ-binding-like beta-propeller repeat protein, partial [Mycobacteriales bacterium]
MRTRWAAVGLAALATLTACGSSSPRTAPSRTPVSSAVPATSAPQAGGRAVGQYHGDARHTGAYEGISAPTSLAVGWNRDLDGAVYAQPLVVGGLAIVATENDTVYGLDATTGATRWQTRVGTPQRASALPCGNITPTVGITGTPVYVPGNGRVYVVAEEAGPKHELIALDAKTGAVALRQDVDLGMPGTRPDAMQQRSALTAANGRVYLTFGGRDGDCGAYRGEVIGVPLAGGAPVSYTVPTAREAGMWNAMGPAVDAAGDVFVSVGNGAAGEDPGHRDDPYDHSDSVLKLSPTLQLLDFFAPSNWREQNAGDVDLGSTGPTLLPGGLLLAIGKSTSVYVTRQSRLGGIGGQLSTTDVCRGFGGTAQSGSTVYLPCTDGVRAVTVSGSGAVATAWHASGDLNGSPVLGGGAVWVLDKSSSTLHALSAT